MGVWGDNIKVSIFGESHGASVGVVIDGLPAGLKLNMEHILNQMKRRAPGRYRWSTPRKEDDIPEIQSGLYNGFTTGAPLMALIKNNDQRSSAYTSIEGKARPGHADLAAFYKFNGFNDPRGGGHFSARVTAPLVFAGAVAQQYLALSGIYCGAWVHSIGGVKDSEIYPSEISENWFKELRSKPFPVKDEKLAGAMQDEIEEAMKDGDSVGGIVAAAVCGIPAGWGEPFFNSIESLMASMMFSIPAIKGVEFGDGFKMATYKGSFANDSWDLKDNKFVSETNHNGGINGGLTNGMPVLFNVAFKPTPSISKMQKTVDFLHNASTDIEVKGRHDPCVAPRGAVVVEAAAALVVLNFAAGVFGKQKLEAWNGTDK